MQLRRQKVAFACLIVLAACEPDDEAGTAPAPAVTVEQAVDRSLRLELEERWRIGHEGDPTGTELYRVRAADVGTDGSVFVLDSGNDRIVAMDSMGGFVREIGGPGEGPGEFQQPGDLVVERDTILVRDSGNRIHFFDVSGTLHSTHLLQFPDPEVNRLSLVAAWPGGWLSSAAGYFRNETVEEPPLQREYFSIVRPTTGELEPTGLEWSKPSVGVSHNNFFWLQAILVHRPTYGTDALGRFLVADTATYRIDIYDMEGRLTRRIENAVPRIPLDEKVIDRTEHRPVILRIRAYGSGYFSVVRGDLDPNPFEGNTPAEYDHFAHDGAFLGSTSGPIPLSFDGQSMIALERDSLGVESVVSYRVGLPALER